jgi:hypothetical protein
MEINFEAVGAQNKTAILLGKKPHDASVIRQAVHFGLAAALSRIVYELPASGVEGVANGGVDVLMRVLRLGVAPMKISRPGTLRSTRTWNRLPCW